MDQYIDVLIADRPTREALLEMAKGGGGGGGTGGGFVIHATIEGEAATLDKTWNEINTAIQQGNFPYIIAADSESDVSILYITNLNVNMGQYEVRAFMSDGGDISPFYFVCENPDDYPAFGE